MVAPQGFGDRQNSYAWSMAWFNNQLFVGTDRAQACVGAAGHYVQDGSSYPPPDPDISCPSTLPELPPTLQAEIWSWNPITSVWTRVFQSPLSVPMPPWPHVFTAPDGGFRGMATFVEQSGTQALYVGGFSPIEVWPKLPGARLLRSTDGVNFSPVPQDPGTFLGDLHTQSFRDIVTYNNKMYIVAADVAPLNSKPLGWELLEAANPEQGDNAFQVVSPPGMPVSEIAPYNGHLYVGYRNEDTGFEVDYTDAQGTLPYTYVPVITNGGYKTFPNHEILSMIEFNGSLYLGGNGVYINGPYGINGAELYRINPDNSWDLIVGVSRNTPDGPKPSLSGLGPGFGWNLNDHMWRMAVFDGCLYVGTFDDSTLFRNTPPYSQEVAPELGADLWSSCDGIHFSAIDTRGFEDEFNYGFRTAVSTPYGLFFGTANPYYGTEIWQGIPETTMSRR
ncbi:MAG TPA: hypothetical protein VLW65_02345 [Bryobacteraceae bacterium]|nr:hypothetical protein [Bryobacteraceae bacterium]